MSKFAHFGVPTTKKQPDETYLEGAKVYVTNPDNHPYKVEFVRCEPGCTLPKVIQTTPHAAYVVEDIEAAVEGYEVILPPTAMSESLTIAFVKDGDALLELMQMS